MSREDYFCSEGRPHYNHEEMYAFDTPFGHTAYKYPRPGQSAYEIAVKNGFQGTEAEWIASLKGVTPHIGENGNWFIGDTDTGISAGGSGSGNIDAITNPEIDEYFDNDIINDEADKAITNEEIDSFFNNDIIDDETDEIITNEEIDNFFNL